MSNYLLNDNYFKVANSLFHYELKPIQFSVYCYLLCCAGSKSMCWPGVKTIAACCECSETSVREAIKELEKRGFITCAATYKDWGWRKRQTSNTYYIHELPPLPRKPEKPPTYTDADGKELRV